MSTLKTITVVHPSSAVNNITNDASGNVAVGGALTVGGVAAVAVAPGTSGNVLTSNGTAWTSAAPTSGGAPSAIGQIPFSTNGSTYTATQKITQGTAVASTSGTSIDFTSIPSWVKRVTVMFNGVSTSGSSNLQIQLGTGATPTYTTSGYLGSSSGGSNGSTIVAVNFTAGFGLVAAIGSTSVMHGAMTITNINGNNWVEFGVISLSSGTNAYMNGGSVSLAAALTAVRITTVNGTDTFDAGSINILYE